MEVEAIEVYSECPKVSTVVRHADETDDSEFHCIWKGFIFDWGAKAFLLYCIKKVFLVPRQKVRRYHDRVYGDYLAARVRPQFKITVYPSDDFWLFVSTKDPFGFLVPAEGLDITQYEVVEQRTHTHALQQALCSTFWYAEHEQMQA